MYFKVTLCCLPGSRPASYWHLSCLIGRPGHNVSHVVMMYKYNMLMRFILPFVKTWNALGGGQAGKSEPKKHLLHGHV